MTLLFFLYHFAVLATLLLVLAMLAANLNCFASLKNAEPQPGEAAPLVSVLVPARNEAPRIAQCVRSLLAQNHPRFELLVLDDHSEDETARIVRELGLREDATSDRRLLAGAPLPPGWTGKCWACHQLASHARGEWLCFTDADTVHSPGTIAAALTHAQRTRADLLSAWPRLVTKTLGEKLVIPVIHLLAVALYPHAILAFFQRHPERARRLSRNALRALGGANGQFLFFKNSSYGKIGGHAAVRDHLVEDVALGREIALRILDGMQLVNCDASRLVDCRMYSSFREVWEGFTKNIRPAFEGALALWWLLGTMFWCCFFLPFVLVFFPAHRWFAVAEIALVYVIRVLLTARMRTSWLGCLLHPVGHFLAMCIALNSWLRASRGGVVWKGRKYRIGSDPSSSSSS
jgi:chlorobactene glucosyltransferase